MKLSSRVLPSSETFRANRAHHLALIAETAEAAAWAAAGGGPAAQITDCP